MANCQGCTSIQQLVADAQTPKPLGPGFPNAPGTVTVVTARLTPMVPMQPVGAFMAPQLASCTREARRRIGGSLSGFPLGNLGAETVVSPQQAALLQKLEDDSGSAIVQVAKAYGLGLVKLGVRVDMAPLDWAMGTSNVSSSINANYVQLGKDIYRWSIDMREWARRGAVLDASGKPTGVPYTWTKWADYGKDLLNAVNYQSALSFDSSPVAVLWSTIKETARQVNPNEPKAWPTWLKVLLGAGGLVAGAYVVNTALRAKRELLPSRSDARAGFERARAALRSSGNRIARSAQAFAKSYKEKSA